VGDDSSSLRRCRRCRRRAWPDLQLERVCGRRRRREADPTLWRRMSARVCRFLGGSHARLGLAHLCACGAQRETTKGLTYWDLNKEHVPSF
jgi:hypothetical protein